MDNAASAESTGERTVALLESTRRALGLAQRSPSKRDVAEGALRLLDAGTDVRDVVPTQSVNSLDELVVGVVEAVEECVFSPPRECFDLRARAEVEAARWVDDFLADDATDDESVAAQQVMFLLAHQLADAVAEALIQQAPRWSAGLRSVEEVRHQINAALRSVMRFGVVARWIRQLPRPCRLLRS